MNHRFSYDRFNKLNSDKEIKIKDVLRASRSPYLFYVAGYIDRLEKEIIDREDCSIQAHNDLHYWRDKAREAEKERDHAIAGLKQAADDNGGCWGCKWLDEETDECTIPEGRLMCDIETNDMWEWKGLEK